MIKIFLIAGLFLFSNDGFSPPPRMIPKPSPELIFLRKKTEAISKGGRYQVPQAFVGMATFQPNHPQYITTHSLGPCIGVTFYLHKSGLNPIAALAHLDSSFKRGTKEYQENVEGEASIFVARIVKKFEKFSKRFQYQDSDIIDVILVPGGDLLLNGIYLEAIKKFISMNPRLSLKDKEIKGKIPGKSIDFNIKIETGDVTAYDETKIEESQVPPPGDFIIYDLNKDL